MSPVENRWSWPLETKVFGQNRKKKLSSNSMDDSTITKRNRLLSYFQLFEISEDKDEED